MESPTLRDKEKRRKYCEGKRGIRGVNTTSRQDCRHVVEAKQLSEGMSLVFRYSSPDSHAIDVLCERCVLLFLLAEWKPPCAKGVQKGEIPLP